MGDENIAVNHYCRYHQSINYEQKQTENQNEIYKVCFVLFEKMEDWFSLNGEKITNS